MTPAPPPEEPTYEAFLEQAREAAVADGFRVALGLQIDEAGPERVVGHLDAGPDHHQPYGIVHGGVYCAVVESLASYGAGFAGWQRGTAVVGVSNQTDFIRAHRVGRLDAVAEPIHQGRSQQLWQVRITRASDGALVARGQVRLANLPREQPLAGRPAAG